jgi:hypothetical protein
VWGLFSLRVTLAVVGVYPAFAFFLVLGGMAACFVAGMEFASKIEGGA